MYIYLAIGCLQKGYCLINKQKKTIYFRSINIIETLGVQVFKISSGILVKYVLLVLDF